MEKNKKTEEFLLHMYDATWDDIQHSRNQEWRLLEIVALSFAGLAGLSSQTLFRQLSIIISFVTIGLAIIGIFISIRHRKLFEFKMNIIKNIENYMKVHDADILPEKVEESKFWKTSNFITLLYVALAGFTVLYLMGVWISV